MANDFLYVRDKPIKTTIHQLITKESKDHSRYGNYMAAALYEAACHLDLPLNKVVWVDEEDVIWTAGPPPNA